MKLVIPNEVENDLSRIEPGIRERIVEEIEKLEQQPIPENAIFVEVGDLEVFRLKLQGKDRNSDLNHRVFYQLLDQKIIIRAVYHREKGYGIETENNLSERMNSEN